MTARRRDRASIAMWWSLVLVSALILALAVRGVVAVVSS